VACEGGKRGGGVIANDPYCAGWWNEEDGGLKSRSFMQGNRPRGGQIIILKHWNGIPIRLSRTGG